MNRIVLVGAKAVLLGATTVAGVVHVLFALTNFRPGYPVGEGVAALTVGVALLAAVVVSRWSFHAAAVVAFVGALPLVGWFVYDQGESSDPQFLYLSLIVPVVAGAALILERTIFR